MTTEEQLAAIADMICVDPKTCHDVAAAVRGYIDHSQRLLVSVAAERDQANGQLDAAWGLIANAGGGNWETQTEMWQEAAARWRDGYSTPTMHDAPKEKP